ncbi:DUF6344 domain-containing protein [Streptomyces glaucescens]|uniref:Putative secreted protein n=1 Tax=Streptomyces glaucescens TaxID=1907 RepID=A0A089Z0N0_STRGA|nr:DUF6344 domain-containing protein [Streptomyces glaucescens]AIR99380.1 putative secreted protein [Streptomyces glaucescens]
MARTTVMKLWTAFVTAFLALCTALGLVTTTAAAAVPQTDSSRNSGAGTTATAPVTTQATVPWLWSHATALPPTMKQRIRAEAHGASPTCRHRPLTDAAPAAADCAPVIAEPPGEAQEPVAPPLQR